MSAARRRTDLSPVRGRLTLPIAVLAALLRFGGFAPPGAAADAVRFVPWTGANTPELALSDRAGRTHTLADYRGKVVLVNFWATWCEPCRDEMPSMQRLQEKFAERPFAILAVNYGESDRRVTEFLERASLHLTVLLDPGQDASRAWRVRVLPASFLVGTDGRVRYSVVGEVDWAGPAAVEAVRRLLP